MQRRKISIQLIAVSCLLTGCHLVTVAPVPSSLPYEITRGQLVLHSDFSLPAEHRLLSELIGQRDYIAETIGIEPRAEPIHVFLFGDDQAYYDLLAERYPAFPARRAIFVETDVQLAVYAHWGDHVAEDLRHEVCHGYLHAAVPQLPLWLDEGLAEYFEVGRGRAGLNRPHVELLLAQHGVGGWQPNLARLEKLSLAAELSQQDYAEAWAWVHFLLESPVDKRAVLTEFLASLRSGEQGAPLSEHLAKRLSRPDLALVEHLQAL